MSPSNNEIMSDSSSELDMPADSYQLPFGSDIDWIDVHKVYERDDSVKETTNPKSHSHLHSSKNVGSNSQRFSGNLMPGIIGLPGNIQNSSILGHSARRPSGIRIIPPKNGSNGKLTPLDNEPGSPKVSCIGKVLSEKSNQFHQKSKAKKAPGSAGKKNLKSEASKVQVKSEHKGPGCLLRMARILCGNKKRAMDITDESICLEKEIECSVSASSNLRREIKIKGKRSLERDVQANETVIAEKERDTLVAVPVPGIGGIKRFASGRKVDWNFQVETDNSGDLKEGKSLENDADVKERYSADNEKDTAVPVLVLGLGGLKRFASGRKVDWNIEEADGGNLAKDETKENNNLENDDEEKQWNSLEKENHTSTAVPVFGISVMKTFASGRKLDWDFEVENDEGCMAKEEAKESNTLLKSADIKKINTFENKNGMQLHVPVLGIGMMKRFPSGRKHWSFEVDAGKGAITKEEENENKAVPVSVSGIGATKKVASRRKVEKDMDDTKELQHKKTSKTDFDMNITDTTDKEKDIAVVASAPRISVIKQFASGRKVDWNFEVEAHNTNDAEEKDDLVNLNFAKKNNAL